MKIALLTPTFSQFSGIDRVVEREIKDLYDKGHKVTLFCFKAEIKSKYAKVIEIGMPNNPTLERIYRLLFFFDILKINKITEKLKDFDKIICYQYPMTLLGLNAKKKYNIHYQYYDAGVAYPHLFQNIIEKIYMKIFRWLTIHTVKDADSAISISNFLRTELYKETGLTSKVRYVKINTKRFKKGIKKGIIRERYDLGKNLLCLYIGRISPHKGIDLLIKAFNLVLKEIPNAKLLIVGKKTFGGYAKKLEKLSNEVDSNAIIFTGFLPDEDLPYCYADSDIYVTASLWEGFDMPIVEAYKCGKPSVAFDVAAHPEVLKKGRLIEPKNIKQFADAIIELMNLSDRPRWRELWMNKTTEKIKDYEDYDRYGDYYEIYGSEYSEIGLSLAAIILFPFILLFIIIFPIYWLIYQIIHGIIYITKKIGGDKHG